MRDKDKPASKPIAEGNTTVEFLHGDHDDLTVQLKTPGGDGAGYLVFESINELMASMKVAPALDKDHPHVRVGCIVCKDSHCNQAGTPWACNYCVCIKCSGSGVRNADKQPCTAIKTQQ